jgi:hypothetical protein
MQKFKKWLRNEIKTLKKEVQNIKKDDADLQFAANLQRDAETLQSVLEVLGEFEAADGK